MTVEDAIKILTNFPKDMEILCTDDYGLLCEPLFARSKYSEYNPTTLENDIVKYIEVACSSK